MKVMAAIIAGGRSRRMGGEEKAFLMLGGRSILAHVIDRIRYQVDGLVINSNGDPRRFADFKLAVVPDRVSTLATPLAGLHASLAHAKTAHADCLLTVPSDTPFLPENLVLRLTQLKHAAIARSGGQDHYLIGVWPVALLDDLETAIGIEQMFRVKDWAARCRARYAEWPVLPFDPFLNVNRPEDLATAEAIINA
jgi:molybdenum cofactor guanylyltransferase